MMYQLDCVFLSFDEPNADENYNHLLSICPRAKRVHGVVGFDAAHKAAANLSETDYFITVDADTVINPIFFNQVIDLESAEQHVFACRNAVTGVSSGNGSIKVWSKKAVLEKNTHESVDPSEELGHALDFWQVFKAEYYLDKNYGITYPNMSPLLAFRSAFRQAQKSALTLLNKDNSNPEEYVKALCQNELEILTTVGLDVRHGIYSILGARLALNLTLNPPLGFDFAMISDYQLFNQFCEGTIRKFFDYQILVAELLSDKYSKDADTIKIPSTILTENECAWFRAMRTMNVAAIKELVFKIPTNIELHSLSTVIYGDNILMLSPRDAVNVYHILNKS
jgi:hypothetical protein